MSDLIKTIDNVQKIIGKSISNVSGDIYNIEDVGNFIITKETRVLERELVLNNCEFIVFSPCINSEIKPSDKNEISVLNDSEIYGRDGKRLAETKLLMEFEYIYNCYNNPKKCL